MGNEKGTDFLTARRKYEEKGSLMKKDRRKRGMLTMQICLLRALFKVFQYIRGSSPSVWVECIILFKKIN